MSENELRKLLLEYKIPIDRWGKGRFKSIKDLYNELDNDDSRIEIVNNELIRVTNTVALIITFKD